MEFTNRDSEGEVGLPLIEGDLTPEEIIGREDALLVDARTREVYDHNTKPSIWAKCQ